VGEIDETEDAVNHCVAQSYESINGPELEAVYELLKNIRENIHERSRFP